MTEFLSSMAWPFLACLVLTGIHVYLGIHVLSRKVIFVDLALAQVAALGSVFGVLLGWDLHTDPWEIKAFSLAFAVAGAAVFSLTRMRNERVPHEALIGITYAVALGATILASSRLAHGAEEVSELLAGNILWVQPGTIAATALLYAAIGTFHWVFRERFLLISLHPEQAEARGIRIRLWDFLFYVSFGFVVTSSVSIAGVLLVFSFLVIPAVIAVLFVDGVRARLVGGWIVGTVVSALGCTVSYFEDLPSGPTIVAAFGASLVLAGLVHHVARSPAKLPAALRVAAGVAAVGLVAVAAPLLRKREDHDLVHLLEAGTPAERVLALARARADTALWQEIRPLVPRLLDDAGVEVRSRLLEIVQEKGDRALLPDVHRLLRDDDDAVRERALRCVATLHDPGSVEPLLEAAHTEEDDYLKVEMAEAVLELDDPRGFGPLIDVLAGGESPQARRDAWEHLRAHADVAEEYRPDLGPTENGAVIEALRRWWTENAAVLRPDAKGIFRAGS